MPQQADAAFTDANASRNKYTVTVHSYNTSYQNLTYADLIRLLNGRKAQLPSGTPAPARTPQPAPAPAPQPAQPAPAPKPVQPAPSSPAAGTVSEFASQVVSLVNQERAKAGLKALTADAALTRMAAVKAKDMVDNNYFSHNSPTYGSPFDMMKSFGIKYSYAGENIAKGQRSPQEVMKAWMNSSGHRANILSTNFTKIGVGYVNGAWVQEFIG